MSGKIYDLIVIGGGINGVGIALDAQGRGLTTALIEKNDLASGTSSASSKLIHGGLRYLEHYQFKLVKNSLEEREILLKKAPYLIKPLRFVMPHLKHLRPAWMIRIGLLLYDYLAKREVLPRSRFIRFEPQTSVLKPSISKGFEYSDCWADDARLVVLNAIQYRQLGGDVRTYSECSSARSEDGIWHISVQDKLSGSSYTLKSKTLVNAAGPWVESLFKQQIRQPSPRGIKLIKGSHIVVPKLYESEQAHILQHKDGRVVFVIPYLDRFSLVGTTDVSYKGNLDHVRISEQETAYLCAVVNEHFVKSISAADVVWSYAGVRALCDDESENPQALTRDYTIEQQTVAGAPLVSVFGGKLTTYRILSESVVNRLRQTFPAMAPAWTKNSPLPGADIGSGIDEFIASLRKNYPFLTAFTAKRMASSYGSRVDMILNQANCEQGLGISFGEQFSEAEVNYLIQHEFVVTVDDALWRRSKMGLFLSAEQKQQVEQYINTQALAQVG